MRQLSEMKNQTYTVSFVLFGITIRFPFVHFRVYNLIAIQVKSTNADRIYLSVNEIKVNLLRYFCSIHIKVKRGQTRYSLYFSGTLCIYNTQERFGSASDVRAEEALLEFQLCLV
ncbi:Hypothetical_protein [Hexamita inflata]|uniref:Hypothetical_protein n=1 Tax=Hexamita inflata TaxID=28002 RepID=A0AA86N4L2_9EUKA|nr:Hypothetical protein HINF_LOCUS400 [Hexamita inflata]